VIDLTTLFAVALVAGLGAYFGSYLREKGKNLATREDVDRVVRATEEIRSQVGGDLWLRQRVWDFKRETYTALLERLTIIRQIAYEHLNLVTGKVTPDLSVEQHQAMVANYEVMLSAMRELRRHTAVGRLFLSPAAIDALEKATVETEASGDVTHKLQALMRYADAAQEKLIIEARQDLKL
jgi:hypothetical protein